MKKMLSVILATLLVLALVPVSFAEGIEALTLNWETEQVQYTHFTDAGNYVLLMEADYADIDESLEIVNSTLGTKPSSCTATCKVNSKGEVILGRNMDIEISQNPAVITMIEGGEHQALTFTYGGIGFKYRYDQLDALDADEDYLKKIPYISTDAMNETGLYIEANMREIDYEMDYTCPGMFPGKEQMNVVSLPALACLNCTTVYEVLDYVNNSYDWYVGTFQMGDKELTWNLAFMIGDAQGNYGLLETGRNGFYFTPYANGQGNYYINPELAQYSNYGSGYGRFAAALEGLPECETEWDMLHNMESCMWRKEILVPGSLGYTDVIFSLSERRTLTDEEMLKITEDKLTPYQEMAIEFYSGNETPLRESGAVWTTSFNFGVNCAAKHIILRLWENDNVIVEYQW